MTHTRPHFVFTVILAASVAPGFVRGAPSVFDDAVARWEMKSPQDTAGTDDALRDETSNAKFGVLLNDTERVASEVAGGDGYAVQLDHATLAAPVGPSSDLEMSGDQLTVALRLKNETDNWDLTLLGRHGGHEKLQYNLYSFDRPGDDGAEFGFEFYTADGYQGQRVAVAEAAGHAWHCLVGRYDGQNVAIFFDGRCIASGPAQGAVRPGRGQPLMIGGEETPDGKLIRQFKGLIDYAAVWRRALSDAEIAALGGVEAPPLYGEPLRPQFHFSPPKNWTNDPNGLLYADGKYHLFYQYNPWGDRWGHMSWGHATSPDLLHWNHLPVALAEENDVMIWSGSAVDDRNNTSGLGVNGRGPLVAVYTARKEGPPERQSQAIAYSNDNGVTWTKYAKNPVIDRDIDAFRDPKVFWYEPGKKWVMVVALPKERKVLFYDSPDLKNWTFLSDFGPAGPIDSGIWECPELIELPVNGDPQTTRWVLQVSVAKSISGGTGGMYFIGQFYGRHFVNDNPPEFPLWVDHGRDFFALQSFNGIPQDQGRHVWLGWVNNWAYANEVPTAPWRGSMSVPREVGLMTTTAGIRLTQKPIRELEGLRHQLVSLTDETVSADHDPLASLDLRGKSLEIVATFKLGSARRFGLHLLRGDQEHTTVGYDQRLDELFVNRRYSGNSSFTRDFGDHQWAPVKPDGSDCVTLRVLVDRSIVEVFGDDGRATITSQVFPKSESDGVSLFAEDGDVALKSLKIYRLRGVWPTQAVQSVDAAPSQPGKSP